MVHIKPTGSPEKAAASPSQRQLDLSVFWVPGPVSYTIQMFPSYEYRQGQLQPTAATGA